MGGVPLEFTEECHAYVPQNVTRLEEEWFSCEYNEEGDWAAQGKHQFFKTLGLTLKGLP